MLYYNQIGWIRLAHRLYTDFQHFYFVYRLWLSSLQKYLLKVRDFPLSKHHDTIRMSFFWSTYIYGDEILLMGAGDIIYRGIVIRSFSLMIVSIVFFFFLLRASCECKIPHSCRHCLFAKQAGFIGTEIYWASEHFVSKTRRSRNICTVMWFGRNGVGPQYTLVRVPLTFMGGFLNWSKCMVQVPL